MGIEHLSIENLFSNEISDDVLVDTRATRQLLGKKGRPISFQTIYRLRASGDLPWFETPTGGFSSVGALRQFVRNRKRGGGANAATP